MTFEQIRIEAAKLGTFHNSLGDRVDNVLDIARINADDTVYFEKSAPVEDWNKIAVDSISDQLCYSNDTEVQDWFKAHGINY